jgi:pyruvate kinase
VLIRRAKIVCTIGPASDDQATLEQLITAGMDVARMNFSHGSHEQHGKNFTTIRAAAKACGRPVAILQDLCGPKIRCGRFPGGTRALDEGTTVRLVEAGNDGEPAAEGDVPIQYEGLAQDLKPGDVVLLDDGRVVLTASEVSGAEVYAKVTHAGTIRDRVGVHLPARRVRLATLTEKDKADLSFGLSLGVDYVALSFVRNADDVRLVREITEAWGRPTPIVSKIETPGAIDHLEAIILQSDAVMVARGDLGVEFPPERVPVRFSGKSWVFRASISAPSSWRRRCSSRW